MSIDSTPPIMLPVKKVLAAIKRRLVLIIAFTMVCTVSAYAVLRYLPPEYTATSIVWLGGREAGAVTDAAWSVIDAKPGNASEENRVATAMLTSIPVLRRVAVSLSLHEQSDGMRGRLSIFRERLNTRFADLMSLAGRGEHAALARGGDDAPAMVAHMHALPDTIATDGVVGSEAAGPDAATAFATAHAVPAGIAADMAERGTRRAVADLTQNLSVSVDMRAEIAVIQYSGANPTLAAKIVNEVPNALRNERQARLRSGATNAAEWLAGRVDEVRQDVVRSERRVEEFRTTNEIVENAEGMRQDTELEKLVAAIDVARADERAAVERLERARDTLTDNEVESELFNSAAIQRLVALRAEALGRRREYLTVIGPDHSLVQTVGREIAGLEDDVRAEKAKSLAQFEKDLDRARDRLEAAVQDLFEARSGLSAESRTGPSTTSDLDELVTQAEANQRLYQDLLARLKTARQVAAYDRDSIRVIQPALVPTHPTGLSTSILVAAAGAGSLMFALMLVGGLALLDRRITYMEQTEPFGFDALIGAPHVPVGDPAMVASARELERRGKASDRRARLLFDEAARRLLTLTVLTKRDKGCQVVLVTSGSKQEGKSTVSTALARSAARSGVATVLVEADIRKPGRFIEEFDADAAGLVDVLEGRIALDDVIVREESTGLMIVPTIATVQASTERLASAAARHLFEELRRRFELVVLDTPPVCLAPDGELLAPGADSVVFTISHGASTTERTTRAIELIDRVYEGPIIAFVNSAKNEFLESYYGPGDQIYEYVANPRATKGSWFKKIARKARRRNERYTRPV